MDLKGTVRYIDNKGYIEVSKEEAWGFQKAGICEEFMQVSDWNGTRYYIQLKEGIELSGRLSCDGIHKGVLI